MFPDAVEESDDTSDDVASTSVRPPDLEIDTVRDHDDVLRGWDVGADAEEVASWRRDRRPFPLDTVVVAGAALVGLLLGVGTAPRHRGRGAAAGLFGGAVLAAVTRRIWRLQD